MQMAQEECAATSAAGLNDSAKSSHTRVCYIVSNDLVKSSSLLPSNKNRSLLVHALVKQYGMLDTSNPWSSRASLMLVNPSPAEPKDLTVYHTRQYVDFVLDSQNFAGSEPYGPQHAQFGIEEDCPSFSALPQYVRRVAGATLAAANCLSQGAADISVCWDGGRHHAQKSRASGFCYVADCVLGIMALKRERISLPDGSTRKARIMYLDLDLHFSDGVSQAFTSPGTTSVESQVLTLSIHHSAPGFFPVSELASVSDPDDPCFDPYTLSLPLARGASDATFARIWPSVELVKDAFRPDYVVVQCGVDGLASDPYAIWNWSLGSSNGSLGWCVDRICHQWDSKILLLGGGGYNHPNTARAWAYLTSIALGRPLPLDSDIPDHSAFPLYRPSFTLDVPAGNSHDHNTDAYIEDVTARFRRIAMMHG